MALRCLTQPQDGDLANPRCDLVVLGQRVRRGGRRNRGAETEGPRATGSITHAVWEDGTHLLVKMETTGDDGSAYNMFRVDLRNGTVERVLDERTAGGEVQPWVLVD